MMSVDREHWERLVRLYRRWRALAPSSELGLAFRLGVLVPPEDLTALLEVSEKVQFHLPDAEIAFRGAAAKIRSGAGCWGKVSQDLLVAGASAAVLSLRRELRHIVDRCDDRQALFLSLVQCLGVILVGEADRADAGQSVSEPPAAEPDALTQPFDRIVGFLDAATAVDTREARASAALVLGDALVDPTGSEWLAERARDGLISLFRTHVMIPGQPDEVWAEAELSKKGSVRVEDWWRLTAAAKREETAVTRIQVTLGDGTVVSGPLVVAQTIERSFNQAEAGEAPEELKAVLKQLSSAVGKMTAALPEEDAGRAARSLEVVTGEATSSRPDPEWLQKAISALAAAAATVGEIGKPVLEFSARVARLLGLGPEGT